MNFSPLELASKYCALGIQCNEHLAKLSKALNANAKATKGQPDIAEILKLDLIEDQLRTSLEMLGKTKTKRKKNAA